jgi:GTPase SAR1 family protein
MSKIHFDGLAKETVRLIDMTNDLLLRQLQTDNLLREYNSEKERGLDKGQAEQWRTILTNEKNKVNNLEAVVAFVGAVKAGKSTAINAIVGADILPNRSDPMTTYPTLVQHKPGQKSPLLHFPLADEFMQLVSDIKKRLIDCQKQTPLCELLPDLREQSIAERLLSDEYDEFSNEYKGREAIFDLLETINDICRLAASEHIDLPLPAAEDDSGAKMPVIEIQYHHIVDETHIGRLSILDSPGPNEVGQGDRLRRIVHEQLSRASAVVVVCDFTKLKTKDEAELQDIVQEFLKQLSDRLFIFANKFDQRQARDMDVDQTQQYLANNLFGAAVPPNRIFPVSSRRAFLANWARREIDLNGTLPSMDENGHTSDFGQQALGDDWESDINDIERVKRKANVSWDKSLFDKPLEQVIRMAYENAALISLKGASSKILDYCKTIDTFLKIRESVTTKQAKEVKKAIEQIESDIRKIEATRQIVKEKMDGMIDDYEDNIKSTCNHASEEIKMVVSTYFGTGEMRAPVDEEPKRTSSAVRIRKSITAVGQKLKKLKFTVTNENIHIKKRDFPQGSRVLTYSGNNRRDEAEQKVADIQGRLLEIFNQAHTNMELYLDKATEILADHVQSNIHNELDELLEQAKKRLKMSFDVTLNPPNPILNRDKLFVDEILDSAIREGHDTSTTYREKSGLGFFRKPQRWFADLFDTKWGYQKVTNLYETSVVDLQALRDHANQLLGHFEAQIQNEAGVFVAKKLRPNVNDHFSSLAEYLAKFRGDLMDVLEDKQLAVEEQAQLHERIKDFETEIEGLLLDALALETGLDAL